MNFKQVEAFRAVMTTRSMTTAAGLLHTSQPNVSRWIGLLEKKVGFVLFQRRGTVLIPTSEAEAFYSEVERAFLGLESLNESANSIRRKGTGVLRVGAVGSITQCVLPEAMRGFSTSFPDTPVVLHTGKSDVVSKWVSTGFCDIGFCSIPTEIPGLNYERINTAYGVAIVNRSHELSSRAIVRPSDFENQRFISLPAGGLNRDAIDRLFQNVSRILSIETLYATTICSMVGKGLGVSIVNPVVSRALRIPEVCEIPFSDKVEFHSYAVKSGQFPISILASRMAESVQDAFEALNSSLSPSQLFSHAPAPP